VVPPAPAAPAPAVVSAVSLPEIPPAAPAQAPAATTAAEANATPGDRAPVAAAANAGVAAASPVTAALEAAPAASPAAAVAFDASIPLPTGVQRLVPPAPGGLAVAAVGDIPLPSLPAWVLASLAPADAALRDADAAYAIDLGTALRDSRLSDALDQARERSATQAQQAETLVVSGTVVSTGASIGYVLWLARGGALAASLLSALPAWTSLDPLPVLAQSKKRGGPGSALADDEEGEEPDAIEKLFGGSPSGLGRASGAPAAPPALPASPPPRGRGAADEGAAA